MFLYQTLHQNLAIFYVCIVSTQLHVLLDPNSGMPTQLLSVAPHACGALNSLKNLKDYHHPSSCSRDDMQLVQWVLGIWTWKDTPESSVVTCCWRLFSWCSFLALCDRDLVFLIIFPHLLLSCLSDFNTFISAEYNLVSPSWNVSHCSYLTFTLFFYIISHSCVLTLSVAL